jgi:hypothetical protein
MLRRGTAAVGLAMALAACGPAESNTQNVAAVPAPASPASNTKLDACALVLPQELADIFSGRSFVIDNSGPTARNQPGGASRNMTTSCTFVSAGASVQEMMVVSVIVTVAPDDGAQQTIEAMKAGVESLGLGADPADIPGLGDGAYWVNLGGQRTAVTVNVKHDPRIWLAVSESSRGQEVSMTVGHLGDVARRVLSRL